MDRLVVYPERMARNVEMTGGLVFSQRVLLALVDAGMDRQDAYKIVQRHALAAWDGGPTFRDALRADPAVAAALPGDALDGLFDPWDQLRNVDATLVRLGLLEPGAEGQSHAMGQTVSPLAGAVAR